MGVLFQKLSTASASMSHGLPKTDVLGRGSRVSVPRGGPSPLCPLLPASSPSQFSSFVPLYHPSPLLLIEKKHKASSWPLTCAHGLPEAPGREPVSVAQGGNPLTNTPFISFIPFHDSLLPSFLGLPGISFQINYLLPNLVLGSAFGGT